jgi:transcriptional regulator
MLEDNKPSLEELYFDVFGSNDYLEHVGKSKKDGAPGPGSGRYPLGSGENPFQHSGTFLTRVDDLKKQGLSESEIAQAMGILGRDGKPSSTNLRIQISVAKDEERSKKVSTAKQLREEGYSLNEIAKKMGFKNDSSVRSLLNENAEVKMNQARKAADFLKQQVDEKGMIDVGAGVELSEGLRVSSTKLKEALYILELEGYPTYGGKFNQVTNANQKTNMQVLCPPGTKHKDIFTGEIHSVEEYVSTDGGDTFVPRFQYPKSLDSKRLTINYAEEGGLEKDGTIEIRRGVKDLSLGENAYAQCRILVDGTHYLKGMAIYSDDLPDGVDVRFNTNKPKGTPMEDVLKKIKSDPENPFGSTVKVQSGLINITREDGAVGCWKDNLPSQFLSKQPLQLAKRQLGIAIDDKRAEYDDISALTNPTIKKKMLESFANDCDSAAMHLHAAALPRQKHQVIIAVPSMKDNEVFAPNYKDGEKVALVRFPHGGTFEIPILTVNNKVKNGITEEIKKGKDAVGINSKVAERLSGADFDGDTVLVIPTPVNGKMKINSTPQLEGLKGFDPKMTYGTIKKKNPDYTPTNGQDEYLYFNKNNTRIKVMSNTQNEMGRISNLITDMTLQGATQDELARAVRHSMVVIDAEKHKLDYKQSYADNKIDALKKKYQENGASTIISRAKNETSVVKRQGSPHVNMKGDPLYDPSKPEGALVYKTADPANLYKPVYSVNRKANTRTYTTDDGRQIKIDMNDPKSREKYLPSKIVDKETGNVTYKTKDGSITYALEKRMERSTQMAEATDARTLISKADTDMERLYANYANTMKAMANQARKEAKTTPGLTYSPSAAKKYPGERASLIAKLNTSLKNAPKERMAQTIADSQIKAMKQSNPDMTKEEIKKKSQQALQKARDQVGAHRQTIEITPKEWETIQAGAISNNQLEKILNNTDLDTIRSYATPRTKKALTNSQVSRIKAMKTNGYTNAEIASKLGISASTVSTYL